MSGREPTWELTIDPAALADPANQYLVDALNAMLRTGRARGIEYPDQSRWVVIGQGCPPKWLFPDG